MDKATWARFIRDESGQTTTEYVLILLVVVTLIMNMKGKLLKIIGGLLTNIQKGAEEAGKYDTGID